MAVDCRFVAEARTRFVLAFNHDARAPYAEGGSPCQYPLSQGPTVDRKSMSTQRSTY
jgi:hypothetical protein